MHLTVFNARKPRFDDWETLTNLKALSQAKHLYLLTVVCSVSEAPCKDAAYTEKRTHDASSNHELEQKPCRSLLRYKQTV